MNTPTSDEPIPAAPADGYDGAYIAHLWEYPTLCLAFDGRVLMQYWRSYEDLDGWARQVPHMRWWRWLLENAGSELSFYHEIYQVKAAEAIYEKGCRPVGAALFATTATVTPGEGGSRDRQARFADAASTATG